MIEITEYFMGERQQCMIGILISALSMAIAFYLFYQVKTDLYRGMAWLFIIIPVILLSICIGIIWRAPHDIDRVKSYLKDDKEHIVTVEIPRMQKVLRNFQVIKIIELILLIAGIALMIYASSSGQAFLKGVGFGVAIQSAIMLAFDYFAHERGKIYFDFLQSL